LTWIARRSPFDALTRHWGGHARPHQIRPADRTTLRSFLRRFPLFAVSLADQISRWKQEQGGMPFINRDHVLHQCNDPVFQTVV